MNSPGYKTTPDESGLGGCPSPIHPAQLTGPENSDIEPELTMKK